MIATGPEHMKGGNHGALAVKNDANKTWIGLSGEGEQKTYT